MEHCSMAPCNASNLISGCAHSTVNLTCWPLHGQHGRMAVQLRLPRLRAVSVHVLPLRAEGVLVALAPRERRRLWVALRDRRHLRCRVWAMPALPASIIWHCILFGLSFFKSALQHDYLKRSMQVLPCKAPAAAMSCIPSESTTSDQLHASQIAETFSHS